MPRRLCCPCRHCDCKELNDANTRRKIESLWAMFSPDVREFLLGHQKADDLTTAALLEFWQQKHIVTNFFTQTRDRFHDLAVQYMNLEMKKEQAIMCLSASFWDYLSKAKLRSPDYITGYASINGIDAIELVDVYGDVNVDKSGTVWDYKDGWAYRRGASVASTVFDSEDWILSGSPQFFEAFNTNDTELVEAFNNDRNNILHCEKCLSRHISEKEAMWNADIHRQHLGNSLVTTKNQDDDAHEVEITLIFVNEGKGMTHEKSINPSAALRPLFADYSDTDCCMPLRSLRFSYNERTLFLSTLGRKSAHDLGMNHLDTIRVYSTGSSEDKPLDGELKSPSSSPTQPTTKKLKSMKKTKKHVPISIPLTEEQLKEAHSLVLSTVHEEAEPILKGIRQRLNNLALDCKKPQRKSPLFRKLKSPSSTPIFSPISDGLGGKAGRTRFEINVGQAENLYISTKRIRSKPTGLLRLPTIDLHGCTQDEAIEKLDKILIEWVDTAMKGEYPWVLPATIITGAGNQILSEIVESWIKGNKSVANAPKG